MDGVGWIRVAVSATFEPPQAYSPADAEAFFDPEKISRVSARTSYQEEPAIEPGVWRQGDRVFAPLKPGWLNPGMVLEIEYDKLFVEFDEGGTKRWVDAVKTRPLDLQIGDRVYCRWMGGQTYYSGMIKDTNEDLVFIHYDDGDKEWNYVSLVAIPSSSLSGLWSLAISTLFGRWGCLIWLVIIGVIAWLVNVLDR